MSRLRAAVVGGGIFGVTIAVRLARAGAAVDLFERKSDLLMSASGINQYRLHRGYHYPRSPETVLSAKASEAGFRDEYGAAVIDNPDHYYAIARAGSRTTGDQYLRFCQQFGLEYELARAPVIREEAIEICVRVRESVIDPVRLRALSWERLRHPQIRVHLHRHADEKLLKSYDFAVIATYAALNELVAPISGRPLTYQFELCEKPVVRLPASYRGLSTVIMDGPFMCIDPYGKTGLSVLGNVVHAIHHWNVGVAPEIPDAIGHLLDRGTIPDPTVTKFDLFIDSARSYFREIERAEHVGSMFTIRTVLPDVDATDTRPTLIQRIASNIVAVYSGKIGTCVQAANEVVKTFREFTAVSLAATSDEDRL